MSADAGGRGRHRVASLTRNAGHPVYGGALEIWPADEGFYLVNEVPLETYLAYVVPSEMPSGYHMEALKAQGGLRPDLCSIRSFPHTPIPDCEAHVDGQCRFQVYGNTAGPPAQIGGAETAGRSLT